MSCEAPVNTLLDGNGCPSLACRHALQPTVLGTEGRPISKLGLMQHFKASYWMGVFQVCLSGRFMSGFSDRSPFDEACLVSRAISAFRLAVPLKACEAPQLWW